jgi:hypothetical protein
MLRPSAGRQAPANPPVANAPANPPVAKLRPTLPDPVTRTIQISRHLLTRYSNPAKNPPVWIEIGTMYMGKRVYSLQIGYATK